MNGRIEVLLGDKNAVIYGGGTAITRTCARERAKVFLAVRPVAPLDEVAEDISAAGGVVETARVDTLNEQATEKHANAVAEKAGSIDISFNAIGMGDVPGAPLAEISLQDVTFLVMTWISNLPLDTIYVGGHAEEIEGRR
jgi:NAD(P)-dependent dehydrogenase (short-subunit alcohol dehydrogenase family)